MANIASVHSIKKNLNQLFHFEKTDAKNPLRSKKFKQILGLILLFNLCSKLPGLSNPPDFYFDEVYHGFTATKFLHGAPEAYDPWAKPPTGKAYEWSHPPLAKILMAVFMGIFGEDSFGWRVGSVFFGTAAVGMTCLLAIEIFESITIGILAAIFLSLEGMFFAQSRIAMNDSYFVFFALCTFFFYVKWKKDSSDINHLYLAGTFLGLAAASKWTTLYIMVILGLDFTITSWFTRSFKSKTAFYHLPLALVFIPILIYIGSYFQFFLLGNSFDRFIVIQQQMWWYHSNLKATHPYQSVPWQWIFNLRPVWMYVGNVGPEKVSTIYNLGNSVVLLSGLVAVSAYTFQEKKRSWARGFTLLCYFMLWVPWSFSPRIMLFYHYMPAVPFLCMILARELETRRIQNPASGLKWTFSLIGLSLVWFLVFYPHMTGYPVSKTWDHLYYLIPSWR